MKTVKKTNPSVHSVKSTFIMFIITLTYVVSYLQYFGVVIWKNIQRDIDTEMTPGVQIALRSHLLNRVINHV